MNTSSTNGTESATGIQTVQINEIQFRSFLATLAENAGSMAELARQIGVSGQFVGDLVSGKKKPGPKVLDKLGVKAMTVYEITLESTDDE